MKKLKIAGLSIDNVSFSSGQEPDGLDEEFATTFDIDFSINGKELSQLLDVQQRVLDKKIKKLTVKEALKLLSNNRKVQKYLDKLAGKKIRDEFQGFFMDSLFDSGWGDFKITDVELETDNISDWTADIDLKGNEIKFSVTYSVLGEFKDYEDQEERWE